MSETELSRRLDRLDRVVSADQRLTRSERKQLKREREHKESTVLGGSIMLIAAVVMAVTGVLNPEKFWLLFVALGLALGGGKQISVARSREKQLAPTQKVDRFESACDQLLAELKDSPAAVRDFLGQPEATVEAIRAAQRQLKQRHASMLETISPERVADLEQERRELQARLGHLDESTYKRATDALRLRTELFNQVRSSAERLASEQQILLTSLESLRMRVALAKGAGGQGATLNDMKREVDRLGDELSAITDALEGVQAVAPIESDDSIAGAPGRRERS